jgi:WD40 repeat protein
MKFLTCVAAALWLAASMAVGQAPREPGVDSLGDPLPPNALLRLGSLRFRHPGTVYELALSPDERTIVSMGDKIIAWDAATGRQLWNDSLRRAGVEINGVGYGMRLLTFSPDGRIYTPMGPGSIVARDSATGKFNASDVIRLEGALLPQAANRGFGVSPRSVDASPDGTRLAIGSSAGLIVCDLAGKTLFTLPNRPQVPVAIEDMNQDRLLFGGDYTSGQFSPDGKLLAVVASEAPREIRLVDATTGAELRRIALSEKVVRLAFSPDGKRIAATERNPPKTPDAAVRLYDVDTGQPVWSHIVKLDNPYENYTSAIAFAPDGISLAAGATDNKIYLLDAATGDEQAALAGTNWYPWALTYTRDGATLYSSGWDGMVRRWDVAARTQRPLPAGVRGTGTVAISPDGSRIAYEDDGGVIHLVDGADGVELRPLSLPQAEYSDLVFSPDGRQLAGGGDCGDDVHVALWDVASGELVRRWDWPKGRDPHSTAESLRFSPDGRRLAAIVFRQDVVKSWDLDSGELLAENKHNEVFGAAYSPAGETLATVGWDSTIRLWEAATGKLRQEQSVKPPAERAQNVGAWMANEDMRIYAIAYSPWDGTLATSHMNNELRIWNAADLSLRKVIRSEAGFSQGNLQYSPNGQWLCAGRADGVVQLWDAAEGKSAWIVGAHDDDHKVVEFSDDGARLLTGGSDGAGYLWDLRPAGNHPFYKKSLESLERLFFSDDANGAYCAFWALAAQPDAALPLLAARLRAVDSLLDPNAAESGADEADQARTQRLKMLVLEKDESVLSPAAAHRAIAILRHLGTPESQALLGELAARNPDGDFARLAARALKWPPADERP